MVEVGGELGGCGVLKGIGNLKERGIGMVGGERLNEVNEILEDIEGSLGKE